CVWRCVGISMRVCVCVSWTSVPECVCVSEAMCVCAAGSAGLDVSLCEVTLVSDQIPRHFLCRRNNRALTSENLPHSLSLSLSPFSTLSLFYQLPFAFCSVFIFSVEDSVSSVSF